MPPILSLSTTSDSPLTGSARAASTVALPQSANHFAGIDAVRGLAAVAVVLLHACIPYAQPTMSGLDWSVRDTNSGIVTVLLWTIEIAIMPIFLVIAGFFAARSMASRDPWSTMSHRLRRLGVPLGLAMVLILPIGFYTWMLGWLIEGTVSVREIRRMKFQPGVDQHLWGLSHLWFLQYLITYIILLAVSWPVLCRLRSRTLSSYGMSILYLIAVTALAMRPEVVWGFQHAFLPVLSKWVYSGAFFVAGVFWFRCDPQLTRLAIMGRRVLGPGVLMTAAAVSIGMWWLAAAGPSDAWLGGGWSSASSQTLMQRSSGGLPIFGLPIRGAMAMLTVAAAGLLTFGLIGWAAAHVRQLGPRMSSLASASLLIYLLHHPIVGLTHIVAKVSLPGVSPIWKVSLATSLGVGLGWSVSWLIGRHRERVVLQALMREPEQARPVTKVEVAARRAA